MTEGTMRAVEHAHREDPRNVFAEVFRRGESTAADGGRREGTSSREEPETMGDVSHTAPDGTTPSTVWARGPDRAGHR